MKKLMVIMWGLKISPYLLNILWRTEILHKLCPDTFIPKISSKKFYIACFIKKFYVACFMKNVHFF